MWLLEPPDNLDPEACRTRAEVICLDPATSTNDIFVCRTDALPLRQSSKQNMMTDLHVVPTRRGRAVRLAKGLAIQSINTHGQQVVDT